MGLNSICDLVRLKPVCSVTETSLIIEILHVVSGVIILSRKQITKMLIRLCVCAVWSVLFCSHATKSGFLYRGQSSVYSLFQYIIGDGILLSWTGPCGFLVSWPVRIR